MNNGIPVHSAAATSAPLLLFFSRKKRGKRKKLNALSSPLLLRARLPDAARTQEPHARPNARSQEKKMKERGRKRMMRRFVLLFACVQNCASQEWPPYTGKCAHDPTAKALTHELLEEGYEAYKDIECVPAYLFCQSMASWTDSDCATGREYGSKGVVISGPLNSLLHVEFAAFYEFAGKITWSADTPNLKGV